MNVDQLKEYIYSYNLNNCVHGNQGFNRILLELFGFPGHGKSSLINSCIHVLQDREKEFTGNVQSGRRYDMRTKQRQSYGLTPTISIVDNEGRNYQVKHEACKIYTQLGNYHPLSLCAYLDLNLQELETSLKPRLEHNWGCPGQPNNYFTDIKVPIFVYDCSFTCSSGNLDWAKTFLTNCRDITGIFPIIVLSSKQSDNFAKFHNEFEKMGAEEIIVVDYYTKEDHIETLGRHLPFMYLMYKALENVSFKMQKKTDPEKEQAKMKSALVSVLRKMK